MAGIRRPVAGFVAGPTIARGGGETVGGVTVPPVRRQSGQPAGAFASGWLDFRAVPAWRALYVAGALAYLGVFHFSLPGGLATVGRAGGALPHGHGMAVALYFASWLVIIDAVRDIVVYAYPHVPAASALKQSL